MRTRSAKKLAQRIDLNYFKRPSGLRRWRFVLSLALPLVGLIWIGGMSASGGRAAFSSGPVSSAHAFAEQKCSVCHTRDESTGFRAHVAESACLTCHAAPGHPPSRPPQMGPYGPHPVVDRQPGLQEAPACASCHREHQGRVQLAATADALCVSCHGDLTPVVPGPGVARFGTGGPDDLRLAHPEVTGFPDGHPEFFAARGDYKDPTPLKFNHEVHAKADLRGPNGPTTLECTTCHAPQLARASLSRSKAAGTISPVNYERQCASCHPLFFDERIDAQAPHGHMSEVHRFTQAALRDYIAKNPRAMTEPDPAPRRVPLNFPPDPQPPARTPDEWVARRAARAERYLLERACAFCHTEFYDSHGPDYAGRSARPFQLPARWMPAANFDHAPHLMVTCTSCHAAEKSRETSDVLMPKMNTCATCHAPGKGASASCVECHGYHDWTKAQPVKPRFDVNEFR